MTKILPLAVSAPYRTVGRVLCSLAEVCRRLQNAGELTATGKRIWSRQAVWGRRAPEHILQNPAHQGRAAYGETTIAAQGLGPLSRASMRFSYGVQSVVG